MDLIFIRQLNLVGVLIDPLQDFKWSIAPWRQLVFAMAGETILPEVNPNPIPGFKNEFSPSAVLVLRVPFICGFDARLHVLMHLLNASRPVPAINIVLTARQW